MEPIETWRNHILKYLPEGSNKILSALSDEELSGINSYYSDEDGTLVGVGFTENGKFTKFANPDKARAIELIEQQIKKELESGVYSY